MLFRLALQNAVKDVRVSQQHEQLDHARITEDDLVPDSAAFAQRRNALRAKAVNAGI